MVQVVAGQGLDKGQKGHRAPLGVGDRSGRGSRQSRADQQQIPRAKSRKGRESLLRSNAWIHRRPFLLIEGLDGRRIFGQSLAQTTRELQFAVRQMTNDLRSAPFAGSGRDRGLALDPWPQDARAISGTVEARMVCKRPAIQIARVGIEFTHRVNLRCQLLLDRQ